MARAILYVMYLCIYAMRSVARGRVVGFSFIDYIPNRVYVVTK